MFYILLNIASLVQYLAVLNSNSDQVRPKFCACCGRINLWRHACYERKPDHESSPGESLNPILIQRYYCPGCEKTFSVFPECIPPRRWYIWEVQQQVLMFFILGQSVYAIAKTSIPSYKTVQRWLLRFQEQFRLHKDTLCAHFGDLSRTSGFADFWQACLKKMTVGAAMRLCHVAGVIIP